jgi:hypothetical protein
MPTDYWAVTSINGGRTWSAEQRLTTSSFNGENAPDAGGTMIGDYEGLASEGADAFVAAYEVVGSTSEIDLTTFTP